MFFSNPLYKLVDIRQPVKMLNVLVKSTDRRSATQLDWC